MKTLQATETDTCSFRDVDIGGRELFIVKGYRPLHRPVSYALRSIFTMNNETLNIWTHLLPAGIFILRLLREIPNCVYDVTRLPIFGVLLGALIVFLASSNAHTFCCLSVQWKRILFTVDHAAVSVYFTMATALVAAYLPDRVFLFESRLFYASVGLPACLVAGLLSALSKLRNQQIKYIEFLRICPFVVSFMFSYIPVIRFFFFSDIAGIDRMVNGLYQSVSFILISVLFKISHFPERCRPGCFDLIGHSHQIFHVFVVLHMWVSVQVMEDMHTFLTNEISLDFIKYVVFSGIVLTVFLFSVIILTIYKTHCSKSSKRI